MTFKNATRLFLLFLIGSLSAHAQRVAVSNNVLFDLDGTLSAGVELPLSGMSSMEAYGSIRPWKRGDESVHKHWLAEAQYRIWPCQVMNGLFFGPYLLGGEFNVGNHDFPLGLLKGLQSHRYEGWLIGGGIGAGYEYALARHWNIGAELGVGYTYIDHKKYNCEVCGSLKDEDAYHYVGFSKLALSLIYIF